MSTSLPVLELSQQNERLSSTLVASFRGADQPQGGVVPGVPVEPQIAGGGRSPIVRKTVLRVVRS